MMIIKTNIINVLLSCVLLRVYGDNINIFLYIYSSPQKSGFIIQESFSGNQCHLFIVFCIFIRSAGLSSALIFQSPLSIFRFLSFHVPPISSHFLSVYFPILSFRFLPSSIFSHSFFLQLNIPFHFLSVHFPISYVCFSSNSFSNFLFPLLFRFNFPFSLLIYLFFSFSSLLCYSFLAAPCSLFSC